MNWKRVRTIARRIWVIAGFVAFGILVWSFQARDVPQECLRSGNGVLVRQGSVDAFTPSADARKAGLIFYPGGMVDPDAYAPIAYALARDGFPVRLVKLPWRSAALESQRMQLFDQTDAILKANPNTRWALAGHSRGGALAAEFIQQRGPRVGALVLIATTHPKDFDLSRAGIPVSKIYATNDGVAPPEEIRKNADLLPPETRWIEIAGGNHAQFGYYGPQLGDGAASISRRRQQQELLNALRRIIDELERQAPSAPPEAHRYTAPPHASIRAAAPRQPVRQPRP